MTPELSDVGQDEIGDRYYKWSDGKEYPSVTTVLKADPEKKAAIKNWRKSHPNPDHYRDRQGQLGRVVHRRVLNQYSIRNLPPEEIDFGLVDDEFMTDVEVAVGMWPTADIDVGDQPDVEVAVRSDKHQYSGRFDLLTTDGVLCDLKISKAVRDSYRMQAAAYWQALREMDGYEAPKEAAIIRLNPDPATNKSLTAKVERINEDQAAYWFDHFKRIQAIYRGER